MRASGPLTGTLPSLPGLPPVKVQAETTPASTATARAAAMTCLGRLAMRLTRSFSCFFPAVMVVAAIMGLETFFTGIRDSRVCP